VILVHGFAQNRYTWRVSQRSMQGELAAQGFDVWNLELRGHGNSRTAATDARFDDYVDDLGRVIAACDAPPFVVGHSLGGGVCVAAATVAPVRGIVHVAGVFSFAQHNPTLQALAKLSVRLSPLLRINRTRFSTGTAGAIVGRLYGLADVAGYGFPLAGWAPGSIERDILEERLRLGFDWTSVDVWLQMAKWATGERFRWADEFGRLDVPLLVIAGDADFLLSPHDARRCYDASGSGDKTFIEFEPFEHQHHWGHLDLLLGKRAPEVVWPVIIEWMKSR
jgi:polyhydroxyalkanoate synthase